MANRLRRPGRYLTFLAADNRGRFLYCKIDRDADRYELFNFRIYHGRGTDMEDMHAWDISLATAGNAIYAASNHTGFLRHIVLYLDAPFQPSKEARGLKAKLNRLMYLAAFKSSINDRTYHRLDPRDYDIVEQPDGTPVITPRTG